MATRRKFGWHSGSLTCHDITVEDGLTVQGNLSFGDATTDTLTVAGLSTFNAAMDVNSTVDVSITSTTNVLNIANAGTGDGVKIANSATNAAATKALLELENTSTAAGAASQGLLIDMNGTGAAGAAIYVDDESTGNASAININSARTGVIALINAEGGASSVLTALGADGHGTNPIITIDNNETDAAAVGLRIDMESTGAACAFYIDATGTNVGPIVTNGVATTFTQNASGAALRITNGSTVYYIPCATTFA